MANDPFSKLPMFVTQRFYELAPSTTEQLHCREIFNALVTKGPMQLMQICVVVTGKNLERSQCKRLIRKLQLCGLVAKSRGKKTYMAKWV